MDFLSWSCYIHLLLSDISAFGSQAFGLGLKLTPPTLLGLQLANGISWEFLASTNM